MCHLQRKLIGFYNRDEKCLQRGTQDIVKPTLFKHNGQVNAVKIIRVNARNSVSFELFVFS